MTETSTSRHLTTRMSTEPECSVSSVSDIIGTLIPLLVIQMMMMTG